MSDLVSINNFREQVDKKKAEILQSATIEIPLSVADVLIDSYVREELLGETKNNKKRGPRGPYKKNTAKIIPPVKEENKIAPLPPKSELDQLAEKLKAAKAAGDQQQERREWDDVLDKQQGNRPRRPI